MFVSEGFPGARNDATAVKYLELVKNLRDGKHFLSQFEYKVLTSDGDHKVMQGCYLICDGGYLWWQCLVCPMKDALDPRLLKFSKHVELIRKDIECTFGILKRRFHILKHWSQQKFQADIDNIFVACCILHNLILEEDGYLEDNLLLVPDELSGMMASIRHKMYAAMT